MMNILIAGGSGFLGRALTADLRNHGHQVFILTRRAPADSQHIQWSVKPTGDWVSRLSEMDGVINLTGFGLEHWPWTKRQKQRFVDSRVLPGLVLAEAFEKASRRPSIFVQASGINRYGLHGTSVADETTPAAEDFLGQLTVKWEAATQAVEAMGVRRVITRTAVVLARRGGQFPLLSLPTTLFFGGKFGDGRNTLNWIHMDDYTGAVRYLLESPSAQGPFNLIAPAQTSGEDFMRGLAQARKRPFWFHIPKWLLRILLGEMSVALTEGRPAQPKRLIDLGYRFKYPTLSQALATLK